MAPYIVGGDTDCSKRIRIQDTNKTHSEGEVFLLSHERGWAVLDVVISFTILFNTTVDGSEIRRSPVD